MNRNKNKDYQKDYAAKKLNDNNNDFCYVSIIIKLKNIVPIKEINSILKINKKCAH